MAPHAQADEVDEKVIEVISRTQRLPAGTVSLDSTFEALNIDSLDGINIIFELEKAFNIEIPDEGISSFRSVRQTADGVRRLLASEDSSEPRPAV